jgi:hypothetical protein
MRRNCLCLTLLFAAFLAGCNLPGEPDYGKGTLTLLLPETTAGGSGAAARNRGVSRSVLPDGFTGTLVYRLGFTGPGDPLDVEADGGKTTVSLNAGQWTVEAKAYDPGNSALVGSGSAAVTVIAGQSSSVRVPMKVDPAYEEALLEIHIRNEEDLRRIGAAENGLSIDNPNRTFYLENDIVLTRPWTPIGKDPGTFKAKFNGRGYRITISSFSDPVAANALYLGFFAYTDGAIIENVNFKYEGGMVDITGFAPSAYAYTGVVAGYADNTIFDTVRVEGDFLVNRNDLLSGDLNTGGMAGRAVTVTIKNCHASGSVSGNTAAGNMYVGGIAGIVSASGSISGTSFTGAAKGNASEMNCFAGGIAGSIQSVRISSSYANGAVHGTGKAFVCAGGITGSLLSTASGSSDISVCYTWAFVKAEGNTTGTGTSAAGGLTGSTSNTGSVPIVDKSYALGMVEVAGNAGTRYAGGIAGENQGRIEYCAALQTNISTSPSPTGLDQIAGYGTAGGVIIYTKNFSASELYLSSTNTGSGGDSSNSRAQFTGTPGVVPSSTSVYAPGSLNWDFSPTGDWKFISGYDYPVLPWQTSPPVDPATL